jgi:hypothetical protein
MFKQILEISMVVCWSGVALSIVMLIRQSYQASKIGRLKLEDLPIRKTSFVELAIDWCHQNIAYKNTKKPSYSLRYYQTKKVAGIYYSSSHECIIYVHKHQSIKEVINIVIHEYVHARQRDKNFDKMYDKYHREVGYDKNPYEVEAREVASKYENECLLWIYNQIQSS